MALLQLASSGVAVLVRPCRLGWQLPPAVRAFLRCLLASATCQHHVVFNVYEHHQGLNVTREVRAS